MDTKFSSGRTRKVYELMRSHRHEYDVRMMCRVLEVTPSGYYAWVKQPQSHRAGENARLLKLIRASFNASNGIYGSPRVFLDLREAGETCSKHRVARLMRANKIRAVRGYSRKPSRVQSHLNPLRMFCSDNSTSAGRIRLGLPILPTYGRGKAGCTWPSSWIFSPGRSLVGQLPQPLAEGWYPMPF
jgi:HTH-like domain